MDRRKFLTASAGAAAAIVSSRYSAFGAAQAPARTVSLRIDPQEMLREIPADFLGLGYEISSVARPRAFERP